MQNLDELLALATSLARSAGEIILEGRRRGFGDLNTKSSSVDIVTEIDLASEEHIVSTLRSKRPDDGVLGEEGAATEGTSGVRWIVDPLDGTVNFTYGIPSFAVSIGIEVDGERAVGVVFNPALDEMFTAVRGRGAYLNDKRLSMNTEPSLEKTLLGTGFSYVANERRLAAEKLVTILPRVRDIRRSGSAALDLCSVACGRLDAYFERPTNAWDVCAGDLIASEAGAVVTDWEGGVANRSVIAANNAVYEQLLALVGSRSEELDPVVLT